MRATMRVMDETRVDRWLCAVRLCKTRPMATDLCVGGHVRVNGITAKPSTRVRVGDRVEAYVAERLRSVEVVKVIESRVSATDAADCLIDHSPPPPPKDPLPPGLEWARGAGRPSKRLRRELDRFRRRGMG
jgi:ribosome-associated heat shock protein Hsp15